MFKGRLGRIGFLLGIVYVFAPMLVALALTFGLNYVFGSSDNWFTKIFSLLVMVFSVVWAIWYIVEAFSLLIRRWHDLNQSGWLSLLQLVPGVNFILLILLLVLPGTKGPSQYGEPASGLGFMSVLFPRTEPAVAQGVAPAVTTTDQPAPPPPAADPGPGPGQDPNSGQV